MSELRVLVVRGDHDSAQKVQQISHWCHTTADPVLHGRVRRVPGPVDVERALSIVRTDPLNTILLTLGVNPRAVLDAVRPIDDARLEVLVESPPAPSAPAPSASLLHRGPRTFAGDPIPHLRKSLLRLSTRSYATVRRLTQPAEFRQYFELRHRVWSAMQYIPEERRGSTVSWEIDYADQTAVPIGAFSHQGEMLGCARLVQELGRQAPSAAIVRQLVSEAGDPKLHANFSYPVSFTHPFDVLASIPAFGRYYRDLVHSRRAKAEVSRVIVDPSTRNQGLGEVLVDTTVSVAHEGAIDVLFLACAKRHEAFYTRCGFSRLAGPTMECERFAGVNAPAIVMDRTLTLR